jgi:hypothetical protein
MMLTSGERPCSCGCRAVRPNLTESVHPLTPSVTEVKVILGATASRPRLSWSQAAISGPRRDLCYSQTTAGLFDAWRFCSFATAGGPRQRSHSRSGLSPVAIVSQVRDPQPKTPDNDRQSGETQKNSGSEVCHIIIVIRGATNLA